MKKENFLFLSLILYIPFAQPMEYIKYVEQAKNEEALEIKLPTIINAPATNDNLISKCQRKKWRRTTKVVEANYHSILKKHELYDESRLLYDDVRIKIACFKFTSEADFKGFFAEAMNGNHEEIIKADLDFALFQSQNSKQRLAPFNQFGVIINSLAGNPILAILKKMDSDDEEYFEYIFDRKRINKIVKMTVNQVQINPSNITICNVKGDEYVTKNDKKNEALKELRDKHQKMFVEQAIVRDIEYFICHIMDSSGFNFLLGNNAQNIITYKSPFIFNNLIGVFHLRELYPQFKHTIMLLQDCRTDASGLTGPVFFGLNVENNQLSLPVLKKHEDIAHKLAVPGKYKIIGLKINDRFVKEVQKKLLESIVKTYPMFCKK